ncbi:MAG: hypothetical protein ACRED1_07130, partial [Limisphaerales bacterium]
MNKRESLLGIRPACACLSGLKRLICALLLFALAARADTSTNGVIAPASGSLNATNQSADLTQMSLEQLMQIQVPEVETASKFEQKATEAPADATVITSDEIKKYGWRTLGALLE